MNLDLAIHLTTIILGLAFFIAGLEYFALPYLSKRLLFFPGWSYLISAISLWFFADSWMIWIPLVSIIVSTWFFTRRFNGGSDSAMFWISLILAISIQSNHWGPFLFLGVLPAGIYLLGGLSKLFSKNWRSGRTLEWSLQQSCFYKKASLPLPAKSIAVLIVSWQFLFPLAVLNIWAAWFFVTTAILFHIYNAYVFGLNRFTFAFAGMYPAILALAPLDIF